MATQDVLEGAATPRSLVPGTIVGVNPSLDEWDVGDAPVTNLDVSMDSARDAGVEEPLESSDNKARSGSSRDPLEEFLTKDQAAAVIQLNAKTIERAIQRGALRAFRVANRVRIRRDDLEAWIAAGRIEPSVHDI